MAVSTEAGKWLAEKKALPSGGHKALWQNGRFRTEKGAHLMRRAKSGPSVKEFVESQRSVKTDECIFVPHAIAGSPSKVSRFGKMISAARYMALLSFGTPRNADAVVRHLCGNGHLSCVNPAHLAWGSQAKNISDAVKHRGCETPQEKIFAVFGKK